MQPDCTNKPPVHYSATLKNGKPLPPYIRHLGSEQKFMITHDAISTYNPVPQTLVI